MYLLSCIRVIVSFYVNKKFLYKWTCGPHLGIWIGIPGLLFYSQCCLRQDSFQPAWQVVPNVVDFLCVLSIASWTICVRGVFKNLYSTSFSDTIQPTLFLNEQLVNIFNNLIN